MVKADALWCVVLSWSVVFCHVVGCIVVGCMCIAVEFHLPWFLKCAAE